jgi:energy-coupling factor transport system permease protein
VNSPFEFLGSVTIGQYLPLDSPIHRLDPRPRLVGYFLLIMAITFSHSPFGLALAGVAVLGGIALSRVSLRYAVRGLTAPLPFLLILALLQVFLNGYPDTGPVFFRIAGIVVGLSDLGAAGMLMARIAVLILALSLASFTLSTSELTLGLGRLLGPLVRLHVPVHDFVMMVQVTLRFLPLLAQTAERIAKGQAARGADWEARGGNLLVRVRRIFPLIVPLFLVSLRRSEQMALAMDARGYGTVERRTSRVELKMAPRDWAALAIAAAISVLIVLV